MNDSRLTEHDLAERFGAVAPAAGTLARSAALLRRITRRLASAEGYDALRRLRKDLDALEGLEIAPGVVLEEARDAGALVSRWLEDEWRRRAGESARELTAFLGDRDVDVRVEDEGLVAPPFVIRIDGHRDRAELLYAGEVVVDGLPLRPERIYDRWVRSRGRLERGSTPPEAFADALIAACEDVRRLRGAGPSARLRLSEVHFRLFVRRQAPQVRHDPRRSRVKEYPRYQFAWDLAGLMEAPEWLDRGKAGCIEIREAGEAARRSKKGSIRCIVGGVERAFGDIRVR